MSHTFSVKFVCSACSTPVYKVTKNVNLAKQWCSPCGQGKSVKQVQNSTEPPQDRTKEQNQTEPQFDPVLSCEKDILYYLRILHRVEELLLQHYKTPDNCHFTALWDQAKKEI